MDYYDSGVVDPTTGFYVDRHGYPVVERGKPLEAPIDPNPTERERSIRTLKTERIEPLGSSVTIPAVTVTSVNTSLLTGTSPVIIRADGASGSIILDNTSGGDAGVKVTPGDPNLIEAIRPGFATANLELRTKGDSILSFKDTDSNNRINITHDTASSVISSANSGADAGLYLNSKGAGNVNVTKDTMGGILQLEAYAAGAQIAAEHSGANSELRIQSKGTGRTIFQRTTQNATYEIEPRNGFVTLFSNGPGNVDVEYRNKGTGKHIFDNDTASGAIQLEIGSGTNTIRALDIAADSSIVIAPKRFGQLYAPNWGFQLYTATTQAISANTDTKVLFLQQSFNTFPPDNTGFFSYNTTNTYKNESGGTCTVLVSASVRGTFDSTIGFTEMWISKNNGSGAFFGKTIYPTGSTSSFAMTATAILQIDAAEDFSVWFRASQPATIGGANNYDMTLLSVRYLP